jgi:hypothetical protein
VYADILNCATGEWPIKYLGVPVTNSKLHVVDWLPVDEKLIKRMDGWKGGALSFGGRLILINSCLSSIPTYYMSMHLLPKTIMKRMDRTKKRFFWQGEEQTENTIWSNGPKSLALSRRVD